MGYNATDTARLINYSGATFKITNDSDISGATGGSITNSGRILKSGGGGLSDISVSTTSTGTISIASGTMNFRGGANSFGGTIDGAGQLQLSGGATTLQNLLKLNVAHTWLSGANVTLGGAMAYAGSWSQTAGTLALGGQTLSLTGIANLDGGVVNGAGTISVAGTTQLKGLFLEGSAKLSNSAALNQTGNWYLGYNATDTSGLINTAGATLSIQGNSDIYGVAGSSLNNAGTIIKSGGSDLSSVAVATINTGNVEVGSGTMTFLKSVSGSGTFTVDAGADLKFGGAVASGSKVTLGAGADLYVTASTGFGGSIAGFALGNIIEVTGLSYTGAALSYSPTLDKLTVTSGSTSVGLQLVGGHASSDFRLISDNGVAAIAHT